jgi:hypothetical protein
MAALTAAQAVINIESFYKTYLPTYVSKLPNDSYQAASNLFTMLNQNGWSVKASYDLVIAQAVIAATTFENAYPSHPVADPQQQVNDVAFANTFPASEVINYLYPKASTADKASLAASIKDGSLTVTDFASAISILKAGSNPTVDQIKAAPEQLTPAANLPDSGLHFPGLTDHQLEFLTSMYIGGFSRAPEFEGLKYWSSELANDIQHGMTQSDAFLAVGHNIYQAGAQNGEAGTTLNTSDYVGFAYNNALGRAPDTAGFNYWVNDLNAGHISRGDFLTTFLTAGMNSDRDATYLSARTAVGEFAAQKHVSGIGAPGIDAKTILNGVTDIASAQTAINGIIAKYGYAPATQSIELVGVSSVAVDAHAA